MNRSRLPVILVLIVALIATGFTRQMAASKRSSTQPALGSETEGSGNASQLSRMNSFALALLLGGLRGPLVMILWTSSESQKTEKSLEDFDTKVEWIRLLQPEFDSVHIFQMWNKAYNISVQMASVANKYLTIIDAIDYGQRVDRERPNNINIIYAIGGIYGDKLGDSAEKLQYSRRVRDDSKPHASAQKQSSGDTGWRKLRLDPVLDDKGRVLEQYLRAPGNVHLVDPAEPNDVYDGSELPFLKRFEPYPYGVGPFGFAYNYRKRAQLLQRFGHQKHSQLSDLVIDSRPALDLKKWGEAEWDHARRLEIRALGRHLPNERLDMEQVTAEVPVSFVTDNALTEDRLAQLREAAYSYGFAQRLWPAADAEYTAHLKRYMSNLAQYASHRDELMAETSLIQGDEAYIKAMLAPPADRAPLLNTARDAYRRAIVNYGVMILKYYIRDPDIVAAAYPPNMTPASIGALMEQSDKVDPNQVMQILHKSLDMLSERVSRLDDEIGEYLTYLGRAQKRLAQLPK